MTALLRAVGGGRQASLRDTALPPNFIYIMTDDVRWDWVLGRQLDNLAVTKNRLVALGLLFNWMRGSYNICAPSRANVMAEGQYWWNNNVHGENEVPNFDYTKMIFTDLWGTVGSRRFQPFCYGKILNGWGNPGGPAPWPVPPNQFVNATDQFGGLINNFLGTGVNEGSKTAYGAYEETYNADGSSNSQTNFFAAYSTSNPATFGDYLSDHMTTKALQFIDAATGRSGGDPRQGLPLFMYLTPTNGHTPFQDPPVYTPDATNRAARLAAFASGAFIRDIYDPRVADSGNGTVGVMSVTDPSGTWSAPYVEDLSKNWPSNYWLGCQVLRGGAMGIVIKSTQTRLILGEWLDPASGNVIFNASIGAKGGLDPSSDIVWATAAAPASGAYSIITARPHICQNDSSQGASGLVVGTGTYGNPLTYNGVDFRDEPNEGRELIGVEDLIERICVRLEQETGQYSLDNTYIMLTSDNGSSRGEFGVPSDKGFPPDDNFRVPMVIRGPGIASGQISDFHMHTCDIGPTIMGLLGQTAHMSRVPDGLDLSPYILGQQPWSNVNNRMFVFNGNPPTALGVITSRYRYYHDPSPPQNLPQDYLIDWRRDPFGLRNLWNAGGTGALGDDLTQVQADLRYTANNRTDSVHSTAGSPVVTDTQITAHDLGKQVTGGGNIPTPAYIGTVIPGVSFRLSSSATTQVDLNANTTATFNAILKGHYNQGENGAILTGLVYP